MSKDSDFHQLSFLFGPPPKVVWLRVGDADTGTIEAVLRTRQNQIQEFSSEAEAAFLILR